MSLYKRLTKTGTISEPEGVPDPRFALPSTVNWMRALALLVDGQGIDAIVASKFYSKVSPRNMEEKEANTIIEQLLFSLHQCSALHALRTIPRKADVARVGNVAWYYGVYAAASAMVTAKAGSLQNSHTKTANTWDIQIADRGLIMPPFDVRISTLVKKDAKRELDQLLTVPRYNLIGSRPSTPDEALGAWHAYLSGSVDWSYNNIKEKVKKSTDFRNLGVLDFRTKAAQQLLNDSLSKHSMGFLHQAFRYRGKANYRDALFLGYGKSTETILTGYIDDLSKVLDAFVTCAGVFCSFRLGATVWDEFMDDVEQNHSFSTSPHMLWG